MSKFRTLMRIHEMKDNTVFFVLPGRDSNLISEVPISDIPSDILSYIKIGSRIFVEAELDLDNDLKITNWELPT